MSNMLEAFGMCCGMDGPVGDGGSALGLSRANLDALAGRANGLVVPSPTLRRESGAASRPKVQCLIAAVGVAGSLRAPLTYATDLALGRGGKTTTWGVVGVGLGHGDGPAIDALRRQDGLFTVVSRGAESGARVVEVVVNTVHFPEDAEAAHRACGNARVRILALCLGPRGYDLASETVAADLSNWEARGADGSAGLAVPRSGIGLAVCVAARRRDAGLGPISFMSCDDVPRNGDAARQAIVAFAAKVDATGALAEWVAARCTFPNSVGDRVCVERTNEDVDRLADDFGVLDACPVVAEDYCFFACDDDFAAGRPNWDLAPGGVGALVEDVAPYEAARFRLLDAAKLGTALFGLLKGHRLAHRALGDAPIRRVVDHLLDAVAPSLPPCGLDIEGYRASLLLRLANPELRQALSGYARDVTARARNALSPTLAALKAGDAAAPPAVTLALAAFIQAFGEPRDEVDVPFDLDDVHFDALCAIAGDVADVYRDEKAALPSVAKFLGHILPEEVLWPRLVDDVFAAFETLHVDGVSSALDAAAPPPVDIEFVLHHR